jgi:hypothetical protein
MNFNLRKYLYKKKDGSPFKKNKINDSFKTIDILSFFRNYLQCKMIYIGKLLRWKNCLN